MNKNLGRLLAGAVAGLAATGAMSLVMWAAKRWGMLGEPPPRRLTRRFLSPLGAPSEGPALDGLSVLAHAGFGATMGGAFALLPGRYKTQGAGGAFGLAVWAAMYGIVLPQLGLMPRPRRGRPGRPSSMAVAHLVYGATLAALERAISPIAAELKGKVVVVCGGSRGLGRALAAELVRQGARVAICGRDAETLVKTHRWLEGFGAPVLADVCDLREEAQTRTFLRRVEQELGVIDVLIANAATIDVGPVEALEPSDFNAAMSEIFGSAMNATLAVLPSMRARQQGTIAIISSVGGKLGVPHLAAYSSAKFAQVGFAEALGAEVSKDGVLILTVAPGLMRTGSHVHAIFHGQATRELAWFGSSAMAPLVSIDAERAARHIVRAIARGERYLTFTPAAHLGTWLHDAAPNLFAFVAAAIARLLPDAPASNTRSGGQEGTELIRESSSPALGWLARWSAPLAARYGQ